jgi:hypothetical protein
MESVALYASVGFFPHINPPNILELYLRGIKGNTIEAIIFSRPIHPKIQIGQYLSFSCVLMG